MKLAVSAGRNYTEKKRIDFVNMELVNLQSAIDLTIV